jgi:hypothetical protein
MASSLLINRIGELVTNARGDADVADGADAGPGRFALISDAALVIEADRIAWKGVLKPRDFLGVRLAVMTMSWISSSDTWSMTHCQPLPPSKIPTDLPYPGST